MRAFIVEGHMERKIIERLCPGTPIRLIGTNGDHVSIATMAKFIYAQMEMLRDRYYPIHVIFDREKREETCDEIIDQLTSYLEQKGINRNQFDICIPDRTIENWFLPFLSDSGDLVFDGSTRSNIEGVDGKSFVKTLFKNNKKPYVETTDGVRLFCSLSATICSRASPSFARLRSMMLGHCNWLAT